MSIGSPQKNEKSPQSLVDGPDFQSWQPATLAKFAHDAYVKMREQEDEIMYLRQDLKTAISAYRDLLRLTGVEQGAVAK
jgi:hypothetical protein